MSEKQISDVQSRLISLEKGEGNAHRALFEAPRIARSFVPFQFVNVRMDSGPEPFLRRPFGISWHDKEAGLVEITWKVVGRGTKMMTEWQPGRTVSILGPLGNGFVLPPSQEPPGEKRRTRLCLVAGGTGLAPMYPLAQEARRLGYEVFLFYGERTRADIVDTGRFHDLGAHIRIATEDGTQGAAGFVTDMLGPWMEAVTPQDVVLGCGPVPMLGALKRVVGDCALLYVSLEARMACGTGLCQGCAVRASGTKEVYFHVCSDGPVFPAGDVFLEGEV